VKNGVESGLEELIFERVEIGRLVANINECDVEVGKVSGSRST